MKVKHFNSIQYSLPFSLIKLNYQNFPHLSRSSILQAKSRVNNFKLIQKFSFSSTKNVQENWRQKINQKQPTVKKQRLRDKYINDFLYFKSIPLDVRGEQLERIMMMPPSDKQYPHQFKQSSKHTEQWFDHNGTKLKSYIWEPNSKPKAIIVCYHSLNGHSLLISDFAEKLMKKGYLVAALDYPNFGKSEGDKRGCVQTFTSVAEPSERFFYHIRNRYQNNKTYMLGYSLGGAVAFCLANKLNTKDLSGVIMLSPAIRQNPYHAPYRKKIAAALAVIFKTFRMPAYANRFGCKYKLDEYLKTDPHIYRQGMWTSTAWTMMAAMLNFSKQFRNLDNPYLLVQSGMDKLVDPFLSVDLDKLSPSKDKTTVVIHDMWHNVWFDDKKDDVMKIVEEWLQERNH